MKRIFIFCLISLTFTTVQAQNLKFPDAPAEFLPYLEKTVFPSTSKNGKSKEVSDIESIWSTLTEGQQQKVIALSQKMNTKRYKVFPYFSLLYESVYHAVHTQNLSGGELDKFLTASELMIEKYNPKQLNRFLETSRSFFEQRALFFSKYNSLYAIGGTFEFKEIPADKPVNNISDKQEDQGNITVPDTVVEKTIAAYEKPVQPEIFGEILVLKNVNLVYRIANDSLLIENTSGSVMFKDGIMVGKGGKVNWSLVELPSVTADIGEYNLDIRSPKFHAEGVTFHYDELLVKPVNGIFDYEYRAHKSIKDAVFPKFISIYNDVSFKDLGKNLTYKGGFCLTGRKISSNSYLRKPSVITYITGGDTKFKLTSRQFDFGDSLITSPSSAVAIFQKQASQDSIIYHPSALLKYNKNAALLELRRPEKNYRAAPFVNTYHKVNITADLMKWHIDSSKIDIFMTRGKDSLPALFESQDYFNEQRYLALKGVYKFHPLQLIISYCNQQKLPLESSPVIFADELAQVFKQNPAIIKGAMADLASMGYVDYDPVSTQVTVFPRVTNAVSSYQNKKDYDNFLIPSYTRTKPNATYDLNSNIMTIRGISAFDIRGVDESKRNKKKPVTIFPNRDAKNIEDREIQMLQNRNFVLSTDYESEVHVGDNTWVGKSFIFDYDAFSIDMREIKSVIYSKIDTVTDESGKKRIRKTPYGSEIAYKPGMLNIDDASNKSGSKGDSGYPKFEAEGGGLITFKDRLKGTYGDSVYLFIPNVKQANLDKAEPIFVGVFRSDGLLPEIQGVKLKYTDGKPGFEIVPPPEGYTIKDKIYKRAAKARLTGKLIMDKNGLHAPGTLEYKSAILKSENILFTPDSITATGNFADLQEKTINNIVYPRVVIKDYKLDWRVKLDSMNISNTKNPFELYKNTCKFDGTVIVSSKGISGRGGLKRKDSEILSDNNVSYKFERDRFSATEAQFRIFSTDSTKPILEALQVNLIFDLNKGQVDIKTNPNEKYAGFSSLEFPYARYRTSINQAVWNINSKQIGLKGDASTSTFTSLDESGQPDLTFSGNLGLYRMDNQLLTIGGIPFIKTADVRVIPRGGAVVIEENALMRELKQCQVVMDTAHEYHKFFDGDIHIISSREFTGNATLKYTNPDNQTFNIKFGNFVTTGEQVKEGKKKVSEHKFTAATGVIEKEDNFRINSRLLFYGSATAKAPEKELEMEGFIKLDLKSQNDLGRWIPYKGGDKNINIDVNDKLEGEGYKLTAGLFIDKVNSGIYTTFLSEKHNPEDDEIFVANGRLSARPEANEFVIASPEKVAGTTLVGNATTINDSTANIEVEGKFNLMHGVPPEYIITSGVGFMDIKAKKFSLNSFMVFNFPMHPSVVTAMGDKVSRLKADNSSTMKDANDDPKKLVSKLAEIVGDKAAKEYQTKSEANYTPLFALSKKLAAPLVLSNLDLKWSEANNSFYSTGKISVSNMGNIDINAQLDGLVEIRKHPEGDEIAIYLEVSPDLWYYFDYKNKQLGVISNDEDFIKVVDKNTGKIKEGQYAVVSIPADEKAAFVDRFKSAYTGEAKRVDTKKPEEKKTEKKPEKKDGF
jgi:hypothetical protein